MASITLRSEKGSPLSNAEVDSNFSNLNTELGLKEVAANKGVVGGYASLDGSGKVPSTQLPSYVDDVVEAANFLSLPGTGETGKIYVVIDTNKSYRWSGSAYVEISASPGSTDAVTEGSTNLYFTNARARAAISATGSLSYNSSTGVLSYTAPTLLSQFTNDSGYITSSALSSYLPLSGGTLSGNLTGTRFTPSGSTNGAYIHSPNDWGIRFTNSDGWIQIGPANTGWCHIYGSQTFYFNTDLYSNGHLQLHSSNYSSYALPLSGGTVTGDVGIGSGFNGFNNISGTERTLYIANGNVASLYLHATGGSGRKYALFAGASGGLAIYDATGDATRFLLNTSSANFSVALQQGGNQVLHAGNYTLYSPSLTGSGASGTWGISVTGSAGSASTATRSTIEDTRAAQRTPDDYEDYRASYEFTDRLTGLGDWHTAFTMQGWHNAYAAWQIIGPASTSAHENFYLRSGVNSTWNPIRTILHSGNYSSYALPLSGGTLTGSRPIEISTSGGYIAMTAANGGGWSMGTYYKGSSGTIRAGFGALGNENDLNYAWIGTGYDGAWMTLTPTSIAVNADFQLGSNYLRFDQSGVRSWNMRATGGNLDLLSGDGLGSFRYNGGVILTSNNVSSYALPIGGGNLTGQTTLSAGHNDTRFQLRYVHGGDVNSGGSGYLTMWASEPGISYAYTGIGANINVGGQYYGRQSTGQTYGVYIRWDTASGQTQFWNTTATPGPIDGQGTMRAFVASDGELYATASAHKVLHAGNYGSYALPLSGGTVSGTLSVSSAYGTMAAVRGSYFGYSSGYGAVILGSTAGYQTTCIGVDPIANQSGAFSGVGHEVMFRNGVAFITPNSSNNGYHTYFTMSGGVADYSAALRQSGNQVLHAGNYTSYSPSLTGSGASGTWGIRITGFANQGTARLYSTDASYNYDAANPYFGYLTYDGSRWLFQVSPGTPAAVRVSYADSAGSADQIDGWGFVNTGSNAGINADTLASNGITYYTGGVPNFTGNSTDGALYSQVYSGDWQHQIAGDYRSGQIALRGKNAGNWQSWRTVLDSGNYSSYALPLSGGTMSGAIRTTANTGIFIGNGVTTSDALRINWHTDGDLNYFIGKRAGAWVQPMDISFYTGIRYHAHQAYGGHRFYAAGYDGNYAFSVGDGDNHVRVYNNLYVSGDSRGYDVYTTGGWFRNHTNNNGIYWSATGWHLYPSNAGNFYVRSGQGDGSLHFLNSSGSSLGYVHAASDAAMGFLTTGGSWRFRVDNSGNSRCYNNLYLDQNYGHGIVGVYASTRYQGVFAMGDSYKLPADGTSAGNLYGLAWSYPSAGGVAGNLDSHGLLVLINGGLGSAISYSIVAAGNVTAYSDERLKTNWRPMPSSFVERLAGVRVGIYDRTDGEQITQVGVSAQSLREVLPEAVNEAKDDMKTLSVSYGNAAMASAVELAKEIVALKREIEALKSKLH